MDEETYEELLEDLDEEDVARFMPNYRPSNVYRQGDEWEAYRRAQELEQDLNAWDDHEYVE